MKVEDDIEASSAFLADIHLVEGSLVLVEHRNRGQLKTSFLCSRLNSLPHLILSIMKHYACPASRLEDPEHLSEGTSHHALVECQVLTMHIVHYAVLRPIGKLTKPSLPEKIEFSVLQRFPVRGVGEDVIDDRIRHIPQSGRTADHCGAGRHWGLRSRKGDGSDVIKLGLK